MFHMNTKLVMTLSAIVMGVSGVILSFMPQEIAALFNNNALALNPVILQVMGALYFGFALTNWTSRANLIGGIYAKPIAIGNFCHFSIGAITLLKGVSAHFSSPVMIPTLVYVAFAVSFAIIFFTSPVKAGHVQSEKF
jgi:hypothetical protein